MQNSFSLFTVSLIFCNMIHLFEETFFSRALFEKMSKGGAGGVAANFELFRHIFIIFYQFYFRALFEKMSKGGAGGAAANVLLLKKNEDK